jgi:hypothetical protein
VSIIKCVSRMAPSVPNGALHTDNKVCVPNRAESRSESRSLSRIALPEWRPITRARGGREKGKQKRKGDGGIK